MNSDFKELLRLFDSNKVEYLVVGGYAYMQYAEPRYTKDIDLWIRATIKNAARVYSTLQQFGAPLSGLKPDDFAREGYFYSMGVAPVRIDILMSLSGVAFDSAWRSRVIVGFEGTPISFISREDLIKSKLAAGRPQDLLDVEILKSAPMPSDPVRKVFSKRKRRNQAK
jgi:hypothetical protein